MFSRASPTCLWNGCRAEKYKAKCCPRQPPTVLQPNQTCVRRKFWENLGETRAQLAQFVFRYEHASCSRPSAAFQHKIFQVRSWPWFWFLPSAETRSVLTSGCIFALSWQLVICFPFIPFCFLSFSYCFPSFPFFFPFIPFCVPFISFFSLHVPICSFHVLLFLMEFPFAFISCPFVFLSFSVRKHRLEVSH